MRDLCCVIPRGKKQADMLVDESRNIVADIEDEPDGNKPDNAVKIDLQKIANDVAIEESHGNFEFRISICELQ